MHIFVQNSLGNNTTSTQLRQKNIWKPQIRIEVIWGRMCYGERTVDLVWVIFGVGNSDMCVIRMCKDYIHSVITKHILASKYEELLLIQRKTRNPLSDFRH